MFRDPDDYCSSCNGLERAIEKLEKQLDAAHDKLEKYRDLTRAADAMSVHGATLRTTDGRLYRTEQGKAYDSARAAVAQLEQRKP